MFVSTLDPPAPILVADTDAGRIYVDYRIATCHETDRDVYVSCVLLEAEHEGERFHEFKFEIAVVSRDGTEPPFRTMERDMAIPYIPNDARPRILNLVALGLSQLIDIAVPRRVYRVTKAPDLPAKALAKHDLLTQVLVDHGYTIIGSGIDRFRRNYWDMLRS